jgi:hypothetical protein
MSDSVHLSRAVLTVKGKSLRINWFFGHDAMFFTCKMWYYIKRQEKFGDNLEGSCKDSTTDFNLRLLFVTEEHQVWVSYLKIIKFVWKAS